MQKKKCLPILLKYSEGKFKFNENGQRFLVFNPSEKIILVIRMVDAKQGGELKNEAHLCIDEVNIACLLLRDELNDSSVIVTGLVTYAGRTHTAKVAHTVRILLFRAICSIQLRNLLHSGKASKKTYLPSWENI